MRVANVPQRSGGQAFDDNITLVSDKSSLPNQRPPLSRTYLLVKAAAAELHFRPANYFEQRLVRRVRLIPEKVVQTIDCPLTTCLLSDC